jgi:hypothetical protein
MASADDDYVLPDGRVLPYNSVPARIDREVRAEHIANMQRLDTEGRRAYLQRVERSEGPECVARLKAAFLEAWEKRKAK